MSAAEVVISVASAAAGAATGSLAVYFGFKKPRLPQSSESQKDSQEQSKTTARRVTLSDLIPKDQVEKSRRELRTLSLEKELVSAALTRLYEAEAAKEITNEEREILGAKYKTELKSLDEKISKIDAFIQIGDLETLRDQLLQLVNQKMDAIDKRIESTRQIAQPLIASMLNKPPEVKPEKQARVPDISDLLEKPPMVSPVVAQSAIDQRPPLSIPENSSSIVSENQSFSSKKSADKVEELQKELLDALDRLEKLDVET